MASSCSSATRTESRSSRVTRVFVTLGAAGALRAASEAEAAHARGRGLATPTPKRREEDEPTTAFSATTAGTSAPNVTGTAGATSFVEAEEQHMKRAALEGGEKGRREL